LARGLLADDVRRLRAPIGLDLGGRAGPQIALSILAQVVADSEGGSGLPKSGPARGDVDSVDHPSARSNGGCAQQSAQPG
jgi:xanthine dehydrogenase accessory factor